MKGKHYKKNDDSKLLVIIAVVGLAFSILITSLVACVGSDTEEPVEAATTTETTATFRDEAPTVLITEAIEETDKQTEAPTEKATEAPTEKATEAATETEKKYELTDDELWEVASVVTGEAGAEPYEGMLAVAQCILQACEDEGLRPSDVFDGYTSKRLTPFDEAIKAVKAVFYNGERVTDEPIKYFYNPDYGVSEWHETQVYVMTIENHKFFKEAVH